MDADSLFVNIFKYRERKNLSPLENFTTEVFTYLLRTLPKTDPTVAKSLFGLLGLADDLEVISQIQVDTQKQFAVAVKKNKSLKVIPDITIHSKRGLVLIEVKVNSSINQYTLDQESIDQIELYNRVEGVERVLTITKYPISSSRIKPDSTFYWTDIYEVLSKSDNEVAKNFLLFLREHEMESVRPIHIHADKFVSGLNSILTLIERAWNDTTLTLKQELDREWLGFWVKNGSRNVGWIGLIIEMEDQLVIECVDPSLKRKWQKANGNSDFDTNDNLIIAKLPISEVVKFRSATEQGNFIGQWIGTNIGNLK